MNHYHLEPELGEEPPILASLEPLLQAGLGLLARRHLLVLRLQRINSNNVLQINIKGVASGHDMVVVHELEESLDTRFLGSFLG